MSSSHVRNSLYTISFIFCQSPTYTYVHTGQCQWITAVLYVYFFSYQLLDVHFWIPCWHWKKYRYVLLYDEKVLLNRNVTEIHCVSCLVVNQREFLHLAGDSSFNKSFLRFNWRQSFLPSFSLKALSKLQQNSVMLFT